MAIAWTEDLAVNIPEIDEQHKELFNRINLLFEACNKGKGRTEIGRTILFLEDYVNTHFAEEERNMIGSHYPGYPGHKEQHVQFTSNLNAIKRQLNEEGPGIHIIIQTNRTVIDWLRDHIRTVDKAFGSYLQGRTSP
jgi:hemerythrin